MSNLIYGLKDSAPITYLINHINAKTVLEIGICEAANAGTLLISTKLETLFGIDLNVRNQARKLMLAHNGRYYPLEGDSRELWRHLRHIVFDVIYVDGGHTDEIVTADINNFYPLLRSGGFMIGDDYENITYDDGEVNRVINAVNRFVGHRPELKLYISTEQDGNLQQLADARRNQKGPCRWYFQKP